MGSTIMTIIISLLSRNYTLDCIPLAVTSLSPIPKLIHTQLPYQVASLPRLGPTWSEICSKTGPGPSGPWETEPDRTADTL
jgi:hypothetical protein